MYSLELYKEEGIFSIPKLYKTLSFNTMEEAKKEGEFFLKDSPVVEIKEFASYNKFMEPIYEVTGTKLKWSYKIKTTN
jgi:hypothetical protein